MLDASENNVPICQSTTDAQICTTEKENAHPITDAFYIDLKSEPKDAQSSKTNGNKRKRRHPKSSKLVKVRKLQHHRNNYQEDAFSVSHPKKRKREDESIVSSVSKNVKQQAITSALNSTAPKHRISTWLRERTAAEEVEWIEKQKAIVVGWANNVLLASVHGENSNTATSSDALRSCDPFTSLRKLGMEASWFCKAKKLYQKIEIQSVKMSLSKEIQNGRLCVRKDRPVYVDVGLQEALFDLLNAYDPLWLTLGLCTVFDSVVPQTTMFSLLNHVQKRKRKDNSPDSKTQSARLPPILRSLVLKHLIHDEKIASNHRHVCNLKAPLSQSDEKCPRDKKFARWQGEEYFQELSNAMALKFLMLVLFLDQAQHHKSDSFTQFPCLFNKKSTLAIAVRQSQTIINEFCRLYFSSEGRIDRHLETLEYKVSYTQNPVDEVNPSINDIGNDLRDGVRLARLLEALTCSRSNEKKLSKYLRVPAVSRLQKVHNVQVCAYYLLEITGFSLSPPATDVRNTFAPIRAKEQIRETEQLVKNLVDGSIQQRTKLGVELLWKLMSWFECDSVVDMVVLKREIEQIRMQMSTQAKAFYVENCGNEKSDTLSETLLEWSRSVCANYSIVVRDLQLEENALCGLVHYYHPTLIPRSAIAQKQSKALEKALWQLGSLPAQMYKLNIEMHHRICITFVACLQSRLIGCRREVDAARLLSRWWRSSLIQSKLQRRKAEMHPSEETQEEVAHLLARKESAVKLQRWWRYKLQLNAVRKIQRNWRTFRNWKTVRLQLIAILKSKRFLLKCVSNWRKRKFAREIRCRRSARSIQIAWRLRLHRRRVLEKIRLAFSSTIIRKFMQRIVLQRRRTTSVNIIIANWKRYSQRRRYEMMCVGCKALQERFRRWREQRRVAAITLQAFFRGKIARKQCDYYGNFQIVQLQWKRKISCWKIEFWFTKQIARTARSRLIRRKWMLMMARYCTILDKLEEEKRACEAIIRCWRRFRLEKVIQGRVYVKGMQISTDIIRRSWNRFRLKRSISNRIERKLAAYRIKRKWNSWRLNETIRKRIETRNAAARIQKCWRLFQLKRTITYRIERRLAVYRIQRSWNSWRLNEAIRKRIERRNAAARIQKCWRHFRLIKALEMELVARRKFAAKEKIKQVRMKHAALKINRFLKCKWKRFKSIILFQAIWRGYAVRKKTIRPEKKEAPPSQPLTLGARLEMALHQLLHGRRLAEVLLASHTIQVCTQYSNECCETCLKLTNVSEAIYQTIKSLNRSRPHVELLHQLLLVLWNLYKFEKRKGVRYYKVEERVTYAEVLMDVVQIHRDMPTVFELATELLDYMMEVLKEDKRKEIVRKLFEDVGRRSGALYHLFEKKLLALDIMESSTTGRMKKAKNGTKTEPGKAVLALKKIVGMCSG
uniref:Abnormal spindlelike microcephalyassociated protein putative n=1 Tax=Albugo laibachii Nc14 TaxID=890382 RepID=F0WEU5_9STRA|nr:abnormal spindlelike microcephalyassociated protein putative [Albugo laibachii Nc14]|eukprot:CCA19727.1 abnormal spindlelike microcephalyassociated protein putative [Albugo laibachii Nc14]